MNTQTLSQPIAKINLINWPQISLRKILISGFVLIVSPLIFYVFQISEITNASFFVSKHEQEIIKLSQQNKSLEIAISQKNSLANLETVLNRLNYEKVSKIYYLRVIDNQVAAKP